MYHSSRGVVRIADAEETLAKKVNFTTRWKQN